MKRQLAKIMMAGAACIALTAGTTMAQNGRFSVGAELGLPMGTFGDGNGIGFGGTLRYEFPLGDKMGLTATAGYLTFSGKTFSTGIPGVEDQKGPSLGIIPVQAGFKYYFKEAQDGFYAMAELGVHIGMASAPDYTDPITGVTVDGGSSTSTNLSYAPSLGYHLANLDFGLRFQLFSQKTETVELTYDPATGFPNGTTTGSTTTTGSYIGLRVAYVFGEK
jgi:hypothetical protein